jgi:hypothetical protein
MDFPISASCQCGQVSYILRQPPKAVLACHCQECQKLSTSPFSVTAMVAADTIEFDGDMHEWERQAESGNRNICRFCPTCGNRIYHVNPDAPDTVKLKLKPVGLDDFSVFSPSAHIWVAEKQDWYEIPEGVAVHQQQPT